MNENQIKNLLITALAVGCLVLGYLWYFSGSDYKRKVKELEKDKSELITQRTTIKSQTDSLQKEYELLVEREKDILARITQKESEIQRLKDIADRSRNELGLLKKGLKETQDKIAELKKNPANRTGADLLNSLKQKTNKQ